MLKLIGAPFCMVFFLMLYISPFFHLFYYSIFIIFSIFHRPLLRCLPSGLRLVFTFYLFILFHFHLLFSSSICHVSEACLLACVAWSGLCLRAVPSVPIFYVGFFHLPSATSLMQCFRACVAWSGLCLRAVLSVPLFYVGFFHFPFATF
jgi:hypothetical protein